MPKEVLEFEDRIKNIQSMYDKLDKLFENIPVDYVKKIKDAVLGNEELKNLIENMGNYRAPRILLIGRTGFGKSSLINALMGRYVAEVNDVKSCTNNTNKYMYSVGGSAPLEILDTRGISESISIDDAQSAEQQILNDVANFDPDIALFVLSSTSRDGIDDDIEFVKNIRKVCYQKNAVELPIVVAINKVDNVTPSRETVPFSADKLKNIEMIKRNIEAMFNKQELKVNATIPVSSCIDWMTKGGVEIRTAEQLNTLTQEERANLTISFDGRYQINELMQALESSVENAEANLGIKMAFHFEQILKKIANNLVNIMSGIGGVVVGVSLPVQDFYVLVAIEALLVSLIMTLSGRDMSFDSAKEFIGSLTGAAGAGLALREIARFGIKFIPAAGNVISGGIAASGVKLIGNAAIEYYIVGKDMEEIKKQFHRSSKNAKITNKGKELFSNVAKKFTRNSENEV